jgi:hypothetical protein
MLIIQQTVIASWRLGNSRKEEKKINLTKSIICHYDGFLN